MSEEKIEKINCTVCNISYTPEWSNQHMCFDCIEERLKPIEDKYNEGKGGNK